MTWTVCQLESDAAGVRLARPSGLKVWRADPPAEGEAPLDAARRRLVASARWVADERPEGGRLDIIVVSVDDASCAWISAPSSEPRVVAAAVRRRDEDWGGAAAGAVAGVQPLADTSDAPPRARVTLLPAWLKPRAAPAKKRPGEAPPAGQRFAVLRMRDSAERLWLDAIDQAGLRVGSVITLWHALARAWSAGPPEGALVAVVSLDPHAKIVWSWSTGPRLVAGGVVARPSGAPSEPTDPPADPLAQAAGRLALDWLTWSAQLGRGPDRIVIVGEGAAGFAERLGALWPKAPIEPVEQPDPVSATLARLAGARPQPDDPREAHVELSSRAGRVHRRLYVWSACALALLAVAVAAFGWRVYSWAGEVRAVAQTRREELRTALAEVSPAAAQSELPAKVLASAVADLEKANPRIAEPEPPRPVLDELHRVAQQLKAVEGSGVEVDRIVISAGPNSQTILRAKDVGTAERLRGEISRSPGRLNWVGRLEGLPPTVTLRLVGEWKQGEGGR